MSQQKTIAIEIQGMDCVGCASNVERAVHKIGLPEARVNFPSKQLILSDLNQKTLKEIALAVENAGYSLVLNEEDKNSVLLDNILFGFSMLTTIYFILAMFFMDQVQLPILDAVLGTILLAIGLFKFGRGAMKSALSGYANMYVLILLGAIVAYVFSIYLVLYKQGHHLYFETTAVIIALVLVGHRIEAMSVKKATSALSELATDQVKDAIKWIDGKKESVSVNLLKIGDQVLVNTGEIVPTDGTIVSGEGKSNESMLTGESAWVNKSNSSTVFGGSTLEEGSFVYQVTQPVHLSTISKINELVQKASTEKADIQKYADKVSAIFVPVIIGIALVWFMVSYFALGLGLEASIIRSIAILVVSCPCAMGLATPVSVMVGLGKFSESGILAKGGSTFENLASIKNLILDKTGTLTTGSFEVSDFVVYGDKETADSLQSVIRSLESKSGHPIAVSVAKAFESNNLLEVNDFLEVKGSGVQGLINGETWKLGNAEFAGSNADKIHDLYLSRNENCVAAFSIKDELKEGVKEAIEYFKSKGIQPIVLSGDSEAKVQEVCKELGIQGHGNLKPEDKLERITDFVSEPTAMVGDGINDAPSLSKVNVGITFSEASNSAVQQSDVVLLNNDFGLVAKAHRIASATLKTIKQNLFWAFAYNLVAIPMAAFGIFSPIIAAFMMIFSDLVVIGNAFLLKLKKIK